MNKEDHVEKGPQVSTADDLLSPNPDSRKALNYAIVAQSAEEVQNIQNAPPLSMGPYLIESGQTKLLTTLSIYSERGASRDQVRLLYMNAVALSLWKAMGRNPRVIGARHRPTPTALLMYGVPFND